MGARSMTGFGRVEESDGAYTARVEVKTLNHRYLDLSVHFSRLLPGEWEMLVKEDVEQVLKRGRVEVYVGVESAAEGAQVVRVDSSLAQQYYKQLKALSDIHDLALNLSASELAGLPGVVELEEKYPEPREIEGLFKSALKGALLEVVEMRRREGKVLQGRLLDLVGEFAEGLHVLRDSAPEVERRRCAALIDRVRNLLAAEFSGIEELDIRNEVALAVQRTSVVEEIDRLCSHVEQFEAELLSQTTSGRKLEFIAGEMLREINTVGAKVSDAELSRISLKMKSALEDIREQVRNIE